MRGRRALLVIGLLASSGCHKAVDGSAHGTERHVESKPVPPELITSEEMRLADSGQSSFKLLPGKVYRVVGRVRNISVTQSGQPQVQFTGFGATLDPASADAAKSVDADAYVALDCPYQSHDGNTELQLDHCKNLQSVPSVSAQEYVQSYENNAFKADAEYKDKEVVISGKLRLKDKLIDGRDYLDIIAVPPDISSATAIIAPEARAMSDGYATVGSLTVVLCQGGYRYNEAGSVGLKDCRFLQNY
ncbi:MAG: hypothetical protein K2X73_12950 [Sphingomonas sp.]|uniref:hypothetical protein n=1 Tax=Sphingomonas sp. TaxID=28214 RepID=UPI0025EC8B25|nr:hypothetical protein [Sphingomonas sp.]MBX9882871.1 hypothetical protein [Sphingomonas sp.]